MASVTEDILKEVGLWLAEILANIGEWIWTQFAPVFDEISGWLDSIFAGLRSAIGEIRDFINDVWDTITKRIASLVGDALDFIREVFDRVSASITDLFDSVTGYLTDLYNTVQETILGIAGQVKTWIVDAFDTMVDGIKRITEDVSIWVKGLFEDVRLAVNTIIDRAGAVVNAIVSAVQEFISEVVDTIGGALRDLLEATAALPDVVAGLGSDFLEAAEQFIGKPLAEIPTQIWESLAAVLEKTTVEDRKAMSDIVTETLYSNHSPPKTREEAREFFKVAMPESAARSWVGNLAIMVLTLFSQTNAYATSHLELLTQEGFYNAPGKILDPADLMASYHQGIKGLDVVTETMQYHGYEREKVLDLIHLTQTTPPEGESLSWWLRELITTEEVHDLLKRKGWDDTNIDRLKKASLFIPPAQDLITMAVRDVFTPEIVERFGQNEGFPPEFAKFARQQGISDEWARRYWAAHWTLPSVQMGFEMLHRSVIEQSDMELLLKAADVMPWWRDKIIAISYAPYTRVDVRRMHKVGVLSDEDVLRAYRDLGYDNDKAEKLTDFTIELNKGKDADDEDELGKLSRSSILGFYEDGLLERTDAYTALLNIGLSENAATLYLNSMDLDEQRQERKDAKGLILDQARAGLITFEDAQEKLNDLRLETKELSKALTKLIRQETQRTKLPSRSDLDKMFTAGIINDDEYRETLLLLGYSELWAGRFVKLLKGKSNDNTNQG